MKLFFIICLFSIINSSAFCFVSGIFDIKDRTSNSINLTMTFNNSTKRIIVLREFSSSISPIKLPKNEIYNSSFNFNKESNSDIIYFSDKKIIDILITHLKAATRYSLDEYSVTDDQKIIKNKNDSSYSFFTRATKPNKQAKNIIFYNVTNNKIDIAFENGNGEGRIIVASRDTVIRPTELNIEYSANGGYGENNLIFDDNHSFVVFNSNKKEKVTKTTLYNLSSGKYWFQVFEYNGSGETINYNWSISEMNPRYKTLPVAAPIAKNATFIDSLSIKIEWDAEAAEFYEIDIAKDEKFNEYVEELNSINVGFTKEFEITFKNYYENIFIRIRAANASTKSSNSNILHVMRKN